MMMHVNQIIMLYTLNLFHAICQLYLKRGKKEAKKNKTSSEELTWAQIPRRVKWQTSL